VDERLRNWTVLAGCFLLSVGANGFIIAPSSIVPLFVERYGITQAMVGDAVSVTFVGLILTQIPSGFLLNRFDNRAIVVPAALLYVLLAVAMQRIDGYEMFLVSRVLGGVLVGLVFTGGANIVGQVVPAGQQGTATGLYLTSPPASFALAHVTSPIVGPAYGALSVFLVHAGVTVVGMVLFVAAARTPIRSAASPSAGEFVAALRNRSVLFVSLSAFAAYALYVFLNTWLPTYGHEMLSLSLADAGVVTAAVPLVGILARSGGGWLSSRIGGRRKPVLVAGLGLGLVLFLLIPFSGTVVLFVLLAVGAGFAVQLGSGVYFVWTRELATGGTEATSLTVLTTILFMGSFSAPIGGGWLISTYSWTVAIVAFTAVGALGVFALLPIPDRGASRPD